MLKSISMKHMDSLFIVAALSIFAVQLFAAGGSGFDWEAAGTAIQTSLTGIVATIVGVVALFGAGAMVALNNGQVMQFSSTAITIALVLGLVFGGAGIIAILYPAAGAVII